MNSGTPGGHQHDGAVRFLLDGDVITLDHVDPTRTVLQMLREDLHRIGTKEGCAEGDCGACTVVLAELDASHEGLTFRAVNACIQFVPTLDGKKLITVESLSQPGQPLHPVQQALVEQHGSQCGFCTPGFVMSLFALYKTQQDPNRKEIDQALSGNLCRCTGYRPIVDAATAMYGLGDTVDAPAQNWMTCSFATAGSHAPASGEQETIDLLRSLVRRDTLALSHGQRRYFAPVSIEALAELKLAHPDACLLAGGTDVGLWVTKQQRDLEQVIYTGNVRELRHMEVQDNILQIGAAVTISDAMATLTRHFPALEKLFIRFASPPIRNAATLGGNITNGSPIGDSMPALIAAGASLLLRRGNETRMMPLEEYYLGYQQTALRDGEFLQSVHVPLPAPGTTLHAYKISKRFDQDIAAVCAAFSLTLENGKVSAARVALGGVAAIPLRVGDCEQAMLGRDWNEATVRSAMAALEHALKPIGDMRASARYRQLLSRNLLYRFFRKTTDGGTSPSVYDYGR